MVRGSGVSDRKVKNDDESVRSSKDGVRQLLVFFSETLYFVLASAIFVYRIEVNETQFCVLGFWAGLFENRLPFTQD